MTQDHEHDIVWRQLKAMSRPTRESPPTESAWCGTCGALFIRGSWQMPTAFAAFDGPDQTPDHLESPPQTCTACGWSGDDEPPSGEELPIVKGALDAQADAEQRANEMRLWVLRLADHFERIYEPGAGTSAFTLIKEARKVAGG